jgi:UMF1 family MFS transporter
MQDTRRSIISWSLYDWANSAFATTVMAGFFPVFFSSYWSSASTSQQSTFYLGLANSIASILVAAMAPVLGAIADNGSYRKRILVFFAFLGAIMTGSLWFVAAGRWQIAVVFYITATIGFSGANTFYDSLLPAVASEKKVDFVSSLGFSLGYIGGGLLFLVNVLMYLNPERFGLPDEATAVRASFMMVAVWWIVFTIPLVLFVKEPKGEKRYGVRTAIRQGFSQIARTLKAVKTLKVTGMFLFAYWCYIDGVDTIVRMAVDYGTALGFPSESLIVALLITQFVAFPAALAYNWFGHKIGVKRALMVAIIAYAAIAVLGFFMNRPIHFYLLACLIGLFQGGIQALSRSYYTRLIPQEQSAQFFGFFNMLGKFAAIVGPLLVGVVTVLTGSNRLGIISLVFLFAAGGILLARVDDKRIEADLADYRRNTEIGS